jgi:putative transposase
MTELGPSERRNCRIVGLARSVQQYRQVPEDDAAVVARMRGLASEYRRSRCPRLLRREGLVVDHKITCRLCPGRISVT